MPALNAKTMLNALNVYFEAIDDVRDRQLRVLSEIRNQQKSISDEIQIWNNILALSYIKHRYAILKQALELLSDSRDHIWLRFGKKNRINHYEPIVANVLLDFNLDDMTKSLDVLREKMISTDFEKKINQIKWNIYLAQAQIAISMVTGALLWITLCVGGLMLALAIQSPALYFCAAMMLIGFPLLIFSVEFLLSNTPYSPHFNTPFVFKNKIAKEFRLLEKTLKTEKDAANFSEEQLDFTIKLSEAQENISEQDLRVSPPTNFTRERSHTELLRTFEKKPLFFSSSHVTTNKTLKEEVEETYLSLTQSASGAWPT